LAVFAASYTVFEPIVITISVAELRLGGTNSGGKGHGQYGDTTDN
jgi:hypothetical protein